MNDLCLIVMDNCQELGFKVNQELQKIRCVESSFITPITLSRFRDGEGKATILETIRGKDVYILSDTRNYNCTYKMYNEIHHIGPDEHFMDIIRTISAIMGHAKNINIVMPFLYASRQHRRKTRESLDCAISLQLLQYLGVKEIITFDVHDPNIQNAIPTLSFDNFFATNDMLKCLLEKENIVAEKTLVVSPDTGAMDRAKFLAKILTCDVGVFYKQRDVSKIENGKNPIVAHKFLGSDVSGLDIIVVDDMLSSGGSMLDVAAELKNRGANKIFFFTTFSLFTEGYQKFDKAYAENIFNAIYSTNLNYLPQEIISKPWFNLVDCSSYLAKIIDCLNRGESISKLIMDNSAINSYNESLVRRRKL